MLGDDARGDLPPLGKPDKACMRVLRVDAMIQTAVIRSCRGPEPAADVAFTPAGRSVVAVSADGSLAAISEPTRIAVVSLPGGAAITELGIDPAAASCEALWVGTPPRLLVLSRFTAHSTLHLLEPHGPRTLAEIRLEAPMRLVAAVGAHALAIGALGAAVITAGDAHLTPYQFPARSVPVAAGAAASQFMVALGGSIEEWDPATRMPKRRLRLPRPSVITAVGGSERIVWMTTQGDPTRIDCLPLVNRGQPKGHRCPRADRPRSLRIRAATCWRWSVPTPGACT